MDNLTPKKSFWERPEGKPGMVVLAGLAVFAGYWLLSNANWIMNAMKDLTTAVFLGAGLAAFIWLASDPKVRNLVWYFYQVIIKSITGFFVEINPIGICKVYIDELKKKRQNMNAQLGKLKQETGKLERKISEQQEEYKKLMSQASVAKNKLSEDAKYKALMTLNARKAGRRKNSTLKLTDLLKKMKAMYEQMNKMYYYSGIMVEDVSDQVEVLEAERNAVRASYNVMKAAQSIIAGNSDEAMLFEQAMFGIADDIGAKVGEMDRFMELSQDFMNGVDLENGVFEEEGLALLEEWENSSSLMFIEEGQPNYLAQLNAVDSAEPVPVQYTEVGEDKQKTNFFN